VLCCVVENELRWYLGKVRCTTGRTGKGGEVNFLLGGGGGKWINEQFIIMWDMFYN
jgi:hypothetical protein